MAAAVARLRGKCSAGSKPRPGAELGNAFLGFFRREAFRLGSEEITRMGYATRA